MNSAPSALNRDGSPTGEADKEVYSDMFVAEGSGGIFESNRG